MAETNKILEVTYGEFSCRLEGFDDAVETMKTVVAYFHELSGHAHFMNMPAQAPDTATLAQLTQEQTGGTVEVENTEHGISLRVKPQQDDATHDLTDSRTYDDASSDDMDQQFADDQPVDVAEYDATDADMAELETEQEAFFTPEPSSDIESDTSVADKLQRIRAVVGRGAPATSNGHTDDLNNAETVAAPKAANPLAQRLAELAKRNTELMQEDALDVASDATAPATGIGEQPEEDAQEEYAVSDTDEAGVWSAAPETDFDEDITALDEPLGDLDPVAAEADAAEEPEEHVAEDADISDDLPEGEAPEAFETAAAIEDSYDSSVDEAEYNEDEDEADAEDEDEILASDEPQAPKSVERPLLLTSRHPRSTVSDEDGDYDDDGDDDFDLKAELADIERAIAARPGNEVARHGLPRSVDDAMSRILNETNQQLDAPEGRRHRDAFAQLKAAVAATEASRQLGDLSKSRDIGADYRDDLGALDAEGKAKGSSLPPLKLVTPIKDDDEDAPKSKALDSASERLRDIAAKVASRDAAEELNFVTFAKQQGAHELSDLLEAAAAYIAYVEGDTDFSRPQVMKVVQTASDEEISREDGLRSFGRLLRQSRIIKLNNGRFQVAENTRFRPDTDRAAQG